MEKTEKRRGRPREKDYSKLNFEYERQLKQGVYLVYNDRVGERYVGKTEESFSERFSKREDEYRSFKEGTREKCHHSSILLFEHEDSIMEWLFIPYELMSEKELEYMEDLLMKHFEYHNEITNIKKPEGYMPFEMELMQKGEWNIPLFMKYGVMEKQPEVLIYE